VESERAINALTPIELLLLDVDGVLTDGKVIFDDAGTQIKEFNAKDGLGIRLLSDYGVKVGIITGRSSQALLHRCQNLGITLLFQGVDNKAAAFMQILEQTGIPAECITFIGDDLPDLPILRRVGVPVAVCDAHEAVKSSAAIVTLAKGGQGAVREICDAILKAKGLWPEVIRRFES
jgi:3-deoxy-D-manno-octulosonate 8-phosphate phosphatase (KDO 8-P phosphatase)